MQKLYVSLFLSLILLTSGCRRGAVANTPSSAFAPVNVVEETSLQATPDEDVKAFELNEEANPFNAPADKDAGEATVDENLTANKRENKLGTIYYEFNESGLRPDQEAGAKKNAEIAKDLSSKGYVVEIEGHACDSAGSDEYNMHLSEDRAEKLKKHFVKLGVNKNKMSTVGRGSRMLIVKSGDREQQAPNRRVEIYAYAQK